MTLNTTRLKVAYMCICCTSVPQPQISVSVSLQGQLFSTMNITTIKVPNMWCTSSDESQLGSQLGPGRVSDIPLARVRNSSWTDA